MPKSVTCTTCNTIYTHDACPVCEARAMLITNARFLSHIKRDELSRRTAAGAYRKRTNEYIQALLTAVEANILRHLGEV